MWLLFPIAVAGEEVGLRARLKTSRVWSVEFAPLTGQVSHTSRTRSAFLFLLELSIRYRNSIIDYWRSHLQSHRDLCYCRQLNEYIRFYLEMIELTRPIRIKTKHIWYLIKLLQKCRSLNTIDQIFDIYFTEHELDQVNITDQNQCSSWVLRR